MTTVLSESEPNQKSTLSVQTYAKTAGLLTLLSLDISEKSLR